jgi:hypothetical protein
MTGKFDLPDKNPTPGPGAYNNDRNKTLVNNPGWK